MEQNNTTTFGNGSSIMINATTKENTLLNSLGKTIVNSLKRIERFYCRKLGIL